MGVWCNDSINGSNPFGRGLNPLAPAKKTLYGNKMFRV